MTLFVSLELRHLRLEQSKDILKTGASHHLHLPKISWKFLKSREVLDFQGILFTQQPNALIFGSIAPLTYPRKRYSDGFFGQAANRQAKLMN